MSLLDVRNYRVMVDIACNDPDNGIFAGRAEQIKIGRDLIELEAKREPAPKFVEVDGGFRLAGKKFVTRGSKDWVGNWCWNSYWMDIPEVVRLLAWLYDRGFYDFTSGEERMFNMWHLPKRPFDKDDLAFFDRMLGKPSNFHAHL